MRLQTLLAMLVLSAGRVAAQNSAFPLESVKIEGSSIPQPVVMEIAGLHLAASINKAGIEEACQRLQESGLFASISYRYAPTAKKGYAVTLALADQAPLAPATIDVPGADDTEAWQFLSARYKLFDHQIPQAGAAQQFLAGELERHMKSQLRGQHLTVRIETDLRTQQVNLSFQPEVLPRVQSVALTGNETVVSSELLSVLNKVVADKEYTDRRFAAAVDLNLRPVYEDHGFYRVRFAPGAPQWSDTGVSVTVAIAEGSPYRLGKVEIAGDNLPVDAMLSAARFATGKPAIWKQIQQGMWEMERVVKRSGFFEATASPDRSYDDAAHVLDLRFRIVKGPLYHFGEIRFTGLSPDLAELVKRSWQPKTGDPYNYAYPGEFFQGLSHAVDLRRFRKYQAVSKKGAGDHVIDIDLVFESR